MRRVRFPLGTPTFSAALGGLFPLRWADILVRYFAVPSGVCMGRQLFPLRWAEVLLRIAMVPSGAGVGRALFPLRWAALFPLHCAALCFGELGRLSLMPGWVVTAA